MFFPAALFEYENTTHAVLFVKMEKSFEASHYTKSLCLYSANNSGNISHWKAKPQKTKVLEKHVQTCFYTRAELAGEMPAVN